MVDQGYDRRSNTTSSIYIKSTITSPNIKSIIQAVSTILHSQMLEVRKFSKIIEFKFILLIFLFFKCMLLSCPMLFNLMRD